MSNAGRQPAACSVMVGTLMLGWAASAQDSGAATYVSMGSSYAAGPGVGLRDASSRGCGRSLSNYAQRLAQRRHLHLIDVACSGATTRDIIDRSQKGFGPQIEAVDAQTDLVTVTVGGNDVDYIANLDGTTCRDTGGQCPVPSDAAVDRRFAALPDALLTIVAEVHRRAPRATLVFVEYLPVIPSTGPATCDAVPLTEDDGRRLRAVMARLDRVIDDVAAETNTLLVRSSVIGAGHEACSAEPDVTGVAPGVQPSWSHPVAYHPNQTGMDRLAEALDTILPPNATR